jgi:hypothetical protein
MTPARTTEELEKALRVIFKAIGQIPFFHTYEQYCAPRNVAGEATQALAAMAHNAAMDSTLLNLRSLNEFFRTDGRPDDIRAHHFSCLSMSPFLTPADEEEINKHLAHLTFGRAEIDAKPWELDRLVVSGLQHGIQFLSFIDASFPVLSDAARTELRDVREAASIVIRKVVKRYADKDT